MESGMRATDLGNALAPERELERLEVAWGVDLDFLVATLIPVLHRGLETTHSCRLAMNQHLTHSQYQTS